MLDTQKWGGFFGLQIGERIFQAKDEFLADLKSDPVIHLGIIVFQYGLEVYKFRVWNIA